MTDPHDDFRTRLRSALSGQGMTQTELARRLGVRDATVSDWFNRGTMPGGSVMLRLPDLLGVDGHWLLTGKQRRAARTSTRPAPEGGAAVPGDTRERVIAQLETALELLREAPTEANYLRVRAATEGEQDALDAVDQHQSRRRPARTRRRRHG